jgi:hypothetical protein
MVMRRPQARTLLGCSHRQEGAIPIHSKQRDLLRSLDSLMSLKRSEKAFNAGRGSTRRHQFGLALLLRVVEPLLLVTEQTAVDVLQ